MDFSPGQCAILLDTARGSIRAAAGGSEALSPDIRDPALLQPAGCFVSLHEFDGRLRGCVGRLEADQPLLSTLGAVAASVLQDPRFRDDPVTLEELGRLELELSIVSPMKPVNNALDFEPLNDGIYLMIGRQAGCFLPQVARQTGWSREQLLARLSSEKLGMPPDAWRLPQARLAVFSTFICGPEAFERVLSL